jgi:hypothetical protein
MSIKYRILRAAVALIQRIDPYIINACIADASWVHR